MDHRIAALDQPVDGAGIADVAHEGLDLTGLGQLVDHRLAFAPGCDEKPHLVAGRQEAADGVGTHVAGATGHCNSHGFLTHAVVFVRAPRTMGHTGSVQSIPSADSCRLSTLKVSVRGSSVLTRT